MVVIVLAALVVLNLPSFGKNPSGERLKRIEKSPNYRDGKFQNLEITPQLTSEKSFAENLYDFLLKKVENGKPTAKIEVVKTDLKNLTDNTLVWLGHSSYLLKVNGKNILIDPVFHSASPFSFMIKPFEYTDYFSRH